MYDLFHKHCLFSILSFFSNFCYIYQFSQYFQLFLWNYPQSLVSIIIFNFWSIIFIFFYELMMLFITFEIICITQFEDYDALFIFINFSDPAQYFSSFNCLVFPHHCHYSLYLSFNYFFLLILTINWSYSTVFLTSLSKSYEFSFYDNYFYYFYVFYHNLIVILIISIVFLIIINFFYLFEEY